MKFFKENIEYFQKNEKKAKKQKKQNKYYDLKTILKHFLHKQKSFSQDCYNIFSTILNFFI
jgi:uncharacterized membrane protein (DUF106 family)